jgi:transposase
MRARCYPSDLSDAQWALVSPCIPPASPGGRPRTTEIRAVFDAILYLLRTGCQWRQLPADFPPWPTVQTDLSLTRAGAPAAVPFSPHPSSPWFSSSVT